MNVDTRARWGPLAGLTALAALLRFSTLGVQSFWLDESITADLLGRDFGGMLSEIPDSESTPPVYYVLAWLWTHVFGTSDVAIRSLSALAGTVLIPVVYVAGSRLISPRTGVVAAAICAVHPYLIWYSQEARAYALVVLFSALAFLYFAEVMRGEGRRAFVLWAVFSSFALATHYFAAFFVGVESAILLLYAARRPAITAISGVGLVAIALAPLLIHQRDTGNAAWIGDEPFKGRVEMIAEYFLVGRGGPVAGVLLASVLALTLAGVLLLTREWRRRGIQRGEAFALAVGAGGLAIPILLALVGVDYFWHQNVIPALVPLSIFAAAGLAQTEWRRAGAAAAAALCALLAGIAVVTAFDESSSDRDEFESAAATLGSADVPRAVIVIPDWCDTTLRHYMPELEPMPVEGRPVREVDVVATTENHGCARSLVPADAPPPIAGFERAGVEREENLLVLRFSSDRPALAEPDELGLLYQRNFPGSVLYESPGG